MPDRDTVFKLILSMRDHTSSRDGRTGERKYHRICLTCEAAFRWAEWQHVALGQSHGVGEDYDTTTRILKYRSRSNKGDRWCIMGGMQHAVNGRY